MENGSLPNKSRKKCDEKININIFLANNVPELEVGSDSESGTKQTNGKMVPILIIHIIENVPNFECLTMLCSDSFRFFEM